MLLKLVTGGGFQIKNHNIVKSHIAELNNLLKESHVRIFFLGNINDKEDVDRSAKMMRQIIKQVQTQENCTHFFLKPLPKERLRYCKYCFKIG